MKKKLTVVFGTEACRYADEQGVKEAIELIQTGELEGMWRTYEMDTEDDIHQLTQALDDAWGWDASTFELVQDENGKWGPKLY